MSAVWLLAWRRRLAIVWVAGWLALAPSAWAADAPAPADCPPAPAVPDAAQVQAGLRQAQDRGFLWRLERGGRSSWLYGTLHIAQPAWMYPGPLTQAALRQADRVALELNLLDPAVVQALQAGLRETQPPVALPEALRQRLQAQARRLCAEAALAGLRPEVQAMTLSLLELRRDGLDAAFGIDGFLAGLSHGLKKRVVGLETPASQLQLMVTADDAERAEQLGQMLDELDSGRSRQQALRLAQAWAGSDWPTLASYLGACWTLGAPRAGASQAGSQGGGNAVGPAPQVDANAGCRPESPQPEGFERAGAICGVAHARRTDSAACAGRLASDPSTLERGVLPTSDRLPWCDCQNTPAERRQLRALLDERNPGMARQIARLHNGGLSVFAAVGALHMVGPTGLPQLLVQQGFVVQAVWPAPPPASASVEAAPR